jgi:bifunctional UDP-N-acetylglucosamine pyrophosphorylase/glucosamine-1-phosphate N-acetyltransferase
MAKGHRVVAKTQVPAVDATGINSRADLAEVSRLMQRRIQSKIMESGVTIVAPELTWIEAGAEFGPETVVQPFTFVGRGARVGAGCRIGPRALLARDERVADGRAVAGNLATDATGLEPVERIARMAMASQGRGA